MSAKVTFTAQPRTLLGKKSNSLRRQGLVPANISGDVEKSVPVMIDSVAFSRLYEQVGDTGLVYLTIEGEKKSRPVLVNEVQVNSLKGDVLHVVFRQVDLTEEVEAEVPVEVIGELTVKNALVVTVHDSIQVKALPEALPEKFEIDVSKFTEAGQSVTFNELNYDKSKVKLLIEEEQMDTPVVLVQEHKEVVEAAPEAPAEGTEAAPAEQSDAAAAADKGSEE